MANGKKATVAPKIGIIGAMKSEVATLKDMADITRREKKAGMEFCEGKLGDTAIVIVKSGVGKVNAAICAQILVDDFAVTHVINTGVAGSLNNALDIGDIVISVDAVQHDMDAALLGFKKGEIPFTGRDIFVADKSLREKARAAIEASLPEVKAVEGRVCSGDQFIASKERKQQIIDDFAGDCTEMEGAAIAQVCAVNDIPFVVLRAISDKADDSGHVSFEQFEKAAAKNSSTLVEYLVRNWGK